MDEWQEFNDIVAWERSIIADIELKRFVCHKFRSPYKHIYSHTAILRFLEKSTQILISTNTNVKR